MEGNLTYFYGQMEKLFSLTQEEVKDFLEKNFVSKSRQARLNSILQAISPYCEKYSFNTDIKLKRKVGKMLFTTLDYDKFADNENSVGTYERLAKLFSQTTARRINPYKIIYRQVLTDGNLRSGYDDTRKFRDYEREFVNIYNELRRVLSLTDDETVGLFEKCSSLISKVYVRQVREVFDCISKLSVVGESKILNVLTKREVIDILKINPSLFYSSKDKICQSFVYICKKTKPIAEENHRHYYDNQEMNELYAQTMIIRKWLKNSSSLLSLNCDALNVKERFLTDIGETRGPQYLQHLKLMFRDPVTLSILDQIPTEKITANAETNVMYLQVLGGLDRAGRYIEDNPYVLAMDKKKFYNLLRKIYHLSKQNPSEQYVEKFFKSGKSLFASNIDFDEAKIIEKLKNQVVENIDSSELEGIELVRKFAELFCDDADEIVEKIQKLIKEKSERVYKGERTVRKQIRCTGEMLRYTDSLLKSPEIDKQTKHNVIENLVAALSSLVYVNNMRGEISGNKEDVKPSEKRNSYEIEKTLNKFRDDFEQKRFKVGKKYLGSEELFEKMMNYLGEVFDDKEAIYHLFRKEVTDPFVEMLENEFNAVESQQGIMFGQHLEVPQVESPSIRRPLQKIAKEVSKFDNSVTISFDK